MSVVAPVFNEVDLAEEFHRRVASALDRHRRSSSSSSTTAARTAPSEHPREALPRVDPRVRVIKFSRNFGHQIAISAGIDHARGDCVAVIDADLQDPPEVIALMVEQWRQGFDVIYGVRSDRADETRLKLWTASMFYKLLGRLTNIHIPPNVGDFRLMSRR